MFDRPVLRVRAVRYIGGGLVAGGITWLIVWGVGTGLALWFTLAMGLTAGLLALTVRTLADETAVPDLGAVSQPDELLASAATVSALESRLSGASHSWRVYRSRLRPMLLELAAERLRRRHGIDVDLDPDEARAVLGDDLYQWMTESVPDADALVRGPSAHTLDTLVRRIEAI